MRFEIFEIFFGSPSRFWGQKWAPHFFQWAFFPSILNFFQIFLVENLQDEHTFRLSLATASHDHGLIQDSNRGLLVVFFGGENGLKWPQIALKEPPHFFHWTMSDPPHIFFKFFFEEKIPEQNYLSIEPS